jgi:general nucleoside transport system permease protein
MILLDLSVWSSAIRLATPLILACLAGLYSERAGIFDIGLEGKMLAGAFTAASVAIATDSVYLGLLAAILVCMAVSLVHGYASITQRGNQIVSGVAINIVAAGLTALLGNFWFGQGGRTPPLPETARFLQLTLPGVDTVRDIPVLGPLYRNLVSGHNILVYLTFLAVPITAWIINRTRFGLRLRAVGENPAAVDTAGISVAFLRYRAVICAGLLCGISGAGLSTALTNSFTVNMSAGRGFIALAALIFAKWRPWPALGACFLFGYLEAVSIRLQGVQIPGIGQIPVQAIQALPYALTVILLAGFIGKAIPPKAGGVPYAKEQR